MNIANLSASVNDPLSTYLAAHITRRVFHQSAAVVLPVGLVCVGGREELCEVLINSVQRE